MTDAALPGIAFIGVGRMGLPIVRLLLKAGYPVAVCDPDAAQRALARASGAREAASVAECVRAADLIFSSLPDDSALREVALGEEGVLQHASTQAVFAETSTVSPGLSAQIAEAAGRRGLAYLRLPLSGNSQSAQTGQLTAFVSGPAQAWSRVKPAVGSFTVAQLYLGEGEQARYMKLVINLVVANTATLLAEALALGARSGLEWQAMLDALAASTISSPWLRAKVERLQAHDFTPTMTPAQFSKDLALMLQAGDALGVPMPMTATTRQLMKAVIAEGYGEQDFIAVVKLVARLAGVSAGEPQ